MNELIISGHDTAMNDLDAIIAAMYESVCYEKGGHPDWETDEKIFAAGARMVRINDAGVFEFDLPSYRENFEQMIASGELPSFWEGEIWRETRLFGDMAHVLSAYETRHMRGGELLNRGVNSIQLFKRGGRWWISAMIWRREGRDVRIPDAARS
jgi:hypothetical protein